MRCNNLKQPTERFNQYSLYHALIFLEGLFLSSAHILKFQIYLSTQNKDLNDYQTTTGGFREMTKNMHFHIYLP